VLIGLVVTAEGFPVGYEDFAGNRNDAMTVDEIVTTRFAWNGSRSRSAKRG
jgi:hypothetical protein